MTQSLPAAGGPPASGPAGADPSMEDVLASIRRILDESAADPSPGLAETEPETETSIITEPALSTAEVLSTAEDVFVLDTAMLIEEPAPMAEHLAPELAADKAPTLLAPEAEEAAAGSLGELVQALTERRTQLYRTGPTLEDLVRDEMRPMLKSWLDANLPAMVERLVREEIERMVKRALA